MIRNRRVQIPTPVVEALIRIEHEIAQIGWHPRLHEPDKADGGDGGHHHPAYDQRTILRTEKWNPIGNRNTLRPRRTPYHAEEWSQERLRLSSKHCCCEPGLVHSGDLPARFLPFLPMVRPVADHSARIRPSCDGQHSRQPRLSDKQVRLRG